MTNNHIQSLIDRAQAENYKGNFLESEYFATESISFLRSNSTEDAGMSHLLLSRALCELAFSFRKRGEGLGNESLAAAEEAYTLALEAGSRIDIAHTMAAIAGSYHYLSDYSLSLEWYAKALEMYEELGDTVGIAKIKMYSGMTHKTLGDYQRALQNYSESKPIFEELGAMALLAEVSSELAYIYKVIGSYDITLEFYGRSLALFQEIGNSRMIAGITANIGAVYMEQNDSEKALEYFGKAFTILEEIGDKHFKAVITWNMGVVYLGLLDYTAAMEYFKRSLAMYELIDLQGGIATATGGIGEIYANEKYEGYDAVKAEEYLLKSIAINDKLGLKTEYDYHFILTELYTRQKRWEEAFAMFKTYHELQKEVQNEQVKKQADKLENERRTAEQEKLLAVERALATATNDILANILPQTITNRLLQGEKKIADTHENVSVLFADIVGFTQLSSQLPAGELIDILDIVFTQFDTICKKHGLEKIKTIGDAYMAVCGAPVAVENHAEHAALAALEMLENFTIEQKFSVPIDLDFRIGLHSGSVVAGIIGKNKYSYDLWGDAVNTASRMESHGEEGKIHVSEEFMRALSLSSPSSPSSLRFVERGEMAIKGKGTMKTYFLEHTI
ncbi:MAG: tetratricopeptide repeat protein [Ignavibacteria bacterium]|nr:tetratricopeptide repeat protein [Ignavibacteria bacterium]